MTDKRKHPSGQPIRHRMYGTQSRPRIPREGYLTPGLRIQPQSSIGAIGFTVSEDEDSA